MPNLDYKMLGSPKRYKTKRKPAKHHQQRFRLESDPVRKVRLVSLRTADLSTARRRAVQYVEERVRQIAMARDPKLRTANGSIQGALQEYIEHMLATGNTTKQCNLVKGRVERIIKQGKFGEYAQIDAVLVATAINDLQESKVFTTTATKNKYLESVRAWSRWMKRNGRWAENPLEDMEKFKGDTTNSRPRGILTQTQFEKLLRVTLKQPDRRNLTGEQRYWLYLVSGQTGLRAQECNSLTPANFHLDEAYVEISNRISKRGKRTGKKDRIPLQPAFVTMLRDWLADKPVDEPLWGSSRSWWYKASELLQHDLSAAGLPYRVRTTEGEAVIDFHGFRGLMVTNAMRTGQPTRVVMQVARLSSEKLLDRYVKISAEEVSACVNAMPLPKIATRRGDEKSV